MSKNIPRTKTELSEWLASKPDNNKILGLVREAEKSAFEGKGNSYLSLLMWRTIHKATLQLPIENRLLLSGLEEIWIDLISEGDIDWSENCRTEHKDVIAAFQSDLDFGLYPAPEILSAMSKMISYYLAMGGAISMDEAFFGVKHNKRTSYATEPMFAVYKSFYIDLRIDILSRYDLDATLEEKALIFMEQEKIHKKKLQNMDLDAFLKGFRRFRGGSPPPSSLRVGTDIQNSKKK